MNPEEFQSAIKQINDGINSMMENHELINDFDQMTYHIHPIFIQLSDILLDYIVNVNEKITTIDMTSFFEEKFPEIIKLDPFIFANPDVSSPTETILAQILKPSYEEILSIDDQYQKQISIFRYINIFSNINDEINSKNGKSVDLIKEVIQQLSLQPIEIEEVY